MEAARFDNRIEAELARLNLEAEGLDAVLDQYEDVDDGLYVRAAVTVQTPSGPVDAWAYLKGPAALP